MLGKKFGPARVLPILMASFGSFTLLTGIFSTIIQNKDDH
jgi:hypothetical protein